MRKPVKNIGASVPARLLNLAKQRNQPFELLLIRYTLERFLYRLSTSKHRERLAVKFQGMVALGLANSRLKDFYDIWILAQTYGFKDDRLAQAIAATFARRK